MHSWNNYRVYVIIFELLSDDLLVKICTGQMQRSYSIHARARTCQARHPPLITLIGLPIPKVTQQNVEPLMALLFSLMNIYLLRVKAVAFLFEVIF